MEEIEIAPQDLDHERIARILRDWTRIEGGTEEQEEEEVAKDPCLNDMLKAARLYLEGNPQAKPGDYRVKQIMAQAAPTHNGQQQQQAILLLGVEFRDRNAA